VLLLAMTLPFDNSVVLGVLPVIAPQVFVLLLYEVGPMATSEFAPVLPTYG